MEKANQQTNPNEAAIARELILTTFSFLETQYHYIPAFKQQSSPLFIDSFGIQYINESRQRELSIRYTKGNFDQELRYILTASIIRIPYLSVKDFFSLDSYLEATGKDFPKNMINEFSAAIAEDILQQMATILKTEALGLIEGKEWWEKYYPKRH